MGGGDKYAQDEEVCKEAEIDVLRAQDLPRVGVGGEDVMGEGHGVDGAEERVRERAVHNAHAAVADVRPNPSNEKARVGPDVFGGAEDKQRGVAHGEGRGEGCGEGGEEDDGEEKEADDGGPCGPAAAGVAVAVCGDGEGVEEAV